MWCMVQRARLHIVDLVLCVCTYLLWKTLVVIVCFVPAAWHLPAFLTRVAAGLADLMKINAHGLTDQ